MAIGFKSVKFKSHKYSTENIFFIALSQKETDANASVSFCASVAVEPAAFLIVPKQREGSRGNKDKTARWAVLSQFLRPKQGETEAKLCFARGSTRLGPSCVGNSRQVGATGGGQRWGHASWRTRRSCYCRPRCSC